MRIIFLVQVKLGLLLHSRQYHRDFVIKTKKSLNGSLKAIIKLLFSPESIKFSDVGQRKKLQQLDGQRIKGFLELPDGDHA